MALFKLTDITFNKETKGPLTKLEDSESLGLDTNILKYPLDLGAYDKGHYMIFYINEQINTQYSDASQYSTGPTIQRFREVLQTQRGPINLGQQLTNLGGAIDSAMKSAFSSDTVQQISQFADTARNVAGNRTDPLGQSEIARQAAEASKTLIEQGKSGLGKAIDTINSGSFLRKVRRTKQAISLYMPDTLTFAYNQSYNDLAVFDTLGNVGTSLAAGSSLVDALKNGGSQNAPVNIASFGLEFLRQNVTGVVGNIANIGLAQLGVASNPGLEVIYGSPSFRQFRFDFLFYPRSRQEGEAVQNIINSLKFHQAPEYATQTGGKFLIPPSEFDIEFYHNGKINPNIPKISTCVLTSIDLDYAPNGFSAYEVPSQSAAIGGTGMPVAIRMSLNFKETQIVTKEYLRWAATGAPSATQSRSEEEVINSAALGDFRG